MQSNTSHITLSEHLESQARSTAALAPDRIRFFTSQFFAVFMSSTALGALLTVFPFGQGKAIAGSCSQIGGDRYVCSNAADPGADSTQFIVGNSLNISTTPMFGIETPGVSSRPLTGAFILIGNEITFVDANNSTISAALGYGIGAINQPGTSGDVTIQTNGVVTGTSEGIAAFQRGEGSINIAASNVNSLDSDGILAFVLPDGDNLSVASDGTILGYENGIYAENRGFGSTLIDVSTVTGSIDHGIYAANSGGDLIIRSSGTVRGDSNGISATQNGVGIFQIYSVDTIGNEQNGIQAYVDYNGGDLLIEATGRTHGRNSGINVTNFGAGTTTANISGALTSEDSAAFFAQGQLGHSINIDLLNGASVFSDSGEAIQVLDANSHLTLHSGSSLAGAVRLGEGRDVLEIHGGSDISQASVFDGGAGEQDELILSGYRNVLDADRFGNWEILKVRENADLRLETAVADQLNRIEIESGAITSQDAEFTFEGDVNIASGGYFIFDTDKLGDFYLGGSVVNNGIVALANSQAGDNLTFDTDLTGNGVIALDVDLTNQASDTLQLSGSSTGTSMGLWVIKLGSGNGTATTYDLISVSGESSENDFRLVNADFVTNTGEQAISDGLMVYRLNYDAASGIFRLTPFDSRGELLSNPGGAIYATAAQQFSDHIAFGTALGRLMSAGRQSGFNENTVTRALNELTTAKRPIIWIQAEGQRDRYSIDDRRVTTNSGDLRYGAALPVIEAANGRIVAGIEVSASTLSTHLSTDLTSADIDTEAYSATISALWISNDQLYVDGQFQYALFDSTIKPQGGASVDTDGRGYGLSIEVGKPIVFDAGFTLVPQAQLMYSDVSSDDVFNLVGSSQAGSFDDSETLTARFGLRAEKELRSGSIIYGQFDYYHSFDNQTSVTFAQNAIITERAENTAGLTLGGNVNVSPRSTLFVELSGETGLGSGSDNYSFGGLFGWEFNF